jgi:hypothetical protein
MLIKYLNGKIVHEDNRIGRALVAAGLAKEMRAGQLGIPIPLAEYEAQKKATPHVTDWRVQPGERYEDFRGRPRIFFSCTCGARGYTRAQTAVYNQGESLRPGANQELVPFVLRHSGGESENIPDHILKEFNRLDAAHQARQKNVGRKRTVQPLDVNSAPTRDLMVYGIRTREMLLAEARTKSKKGPL